MSDDRRLDELNFDADPQNSRDDMMDMTSDMLDLDQELESLKAKKLIDADDMADDEDFLKEPARPAKRHASVPKSAIGLVAVLGVLGGGYVIYGDQVISLMSGNTSSPAPAAVASYPPETNAPVLPEDPASAPVAAMPDSSASTDPAMANANPVDAPGEATSVPGAPLPVPVPSQEGLSLPPSAPEHVDVPAPAEMAAVPSVADPALESPTQADMTTVISSDVPPQPEIMQNDVSSDVTSAAAATPALAPTETKKVEEKETSAPKEMAAAAPKEEMPAEAPVAAQTAPKPEPQKPAPAAPAKEVSKTTEKPVQKPAQEKSSKAAVPQKETPAPVLDDVAMEKEEDMAPLAPPPVPTALESDEYADAGDGLDALNQQGETSGLKLSKQQKQSNLGVRMVDRVQSSNPQLRTEAAFRALDLERYEAASEMFASLAREYPRDERALMGYAVSLQKLGRDAESAQVYEQLLSINPDNVTAMTNYLGLVRKQNPAAAIRRLTDMMSKYPRNATLVAQTGLAYAGAGSYPESVRYLNYAVSLEPTNPGHYYNLAIVAERMNNTALAIQNYEKALQVDSEMGGGTVINRDRVYDRLSYLRHGTSAK